MVVRSVVCEGGRGGGGGGGGVWTYLREKKAVSPHSLNSFQCSPRTPVTQSHALTAIPLNPPHTTHTQTRTHKHDRQKPSFSQVPEHHTPKPTPPRPTHPTTPHHTTPHHTITCICSLALPALSLPHRIPLTQRHPRNNVSLTTLIT